ncbi:MAG: histidinol-phosphate transaminase [Ruminococcaceae bacterium]|nr:histidinol-phosphate transaminase [Oscillospiraceae bacterium]
MSRFFSAKFDKLVPYTPGEQPRDMKYVKLNTNESPFPPSKTAIENALSAAKKTELYSDPECRALREKLAEYYGVDYEETIVTNGSDEVLNFAFMAFCDKDHPAVFPDITYGFYPVFADLNGVPYEEIPLKDDFTIDVNDYIGISKTIFIANPNAPTGISLPVGEIRKIIESNPDNVVLIDEAYVDFGGESCIPLVREYDNLLVTQTFSKSRSMAGARLGFGIGSKKLIADLHTIRYSTNPYNVNSMTLAQGVGMLEDDEYVQNNCKTVIENRAYTASELSKLGFTMPDSSANFIFAKHNRVSGKDIYLKLKEKGVLVRHFDKPRLTDYNRITIGSLEQMNILIAKLNEILEETK